MEHELHVLFLTKYPARGPSSRYRVHQFIPHLEREGFVCTVGSLHAEAYLDSLFAGRTTSLRYYVSRLLARLCTVARAKRYAVVFIQKELLPFVPPLLEFAMHRSGVRIVCDLDDAIHLRYTASGNPAIRLLLARKIPYVLGRCTAVLAGNAFLREYASRFNNETVLFPTVIDLSRYPPTPADARPGMSGAKPVVGWIGSPETVRFLGERAAVLRRLAAEVPFTLRVIGVPGFEIDGVEVEAVPWSEEDEVRELHRCDVGIMPLPDSVWARGKCGLKLLQYMASGLPVVSSGDGAAGEIIDHGVHGFIARSDGEWVEHTAALLGDAAMRERFGRAGRRRVEEAYSLRRWAPRLASILERAAAGESVGGWEA